MLAMQLVDLINGLTTGAVGFALLLGGMLIQQHLALRKLRREKKEEEANNGV